MGGGIDMSAMEIVLKEMTASILPFIGDVKEITEEVVTVVKCDGDTRKMSERVSDIGGDEW
jgi:hypothetical protein